MFQELDSSPATMQAGRVANLLGCIDGNDVQQADATQAYTQTELKGNPTWIRLPRDAWPKEWMDKGYKDPVCPLRLALYGHPDSGGRWEQHLEEHLKIVGFGKVTDWNSCYLHRRLELFLSVYVDDFKLAGP